MRVVYVEDNIANVHLVKRVARMGKHEIINYIDGMDALSNFETDKPDLVLMDIQLAGELTGIEVVQKLREKGYKTPIFAVTAYAMVGDKERCMEAGCTGYMSKPIPIPELVKLFSEYDKPTSEPEQADAMVEQATPVVEKTSTVDEATSKESTKDSISESGQADAVVEQVTPVVEKTSIVDEATSTDSAAKDELQANISPSHAEKTDIQQGSTQSSKIDYISSNPTQSDADQTKASRKTMADTDTLIKAEEDNKPTLSDHDEKKPSLSSTQDGNAEAKMK